MFQTMNFFTPLTKDTKIPQPKINTIKTIAFPCYNPRSQLLNPSIINFIDMNCHVNFLHHPILLLTPVPGQTSFNILTPFIFLQPQQEKTILHIPIVTQCSIRLPKNALLCYMRFISVSEAVFFINHGEFFFTLYISFFFFFYIHIFMP